VPHPAVAAPRFWSSVAARGAPIRVASAHLRIQLSGAPTMNSGKSGIQDGLVKNDLYDMGGVRQKSARTADTQNRLQESWDPPLSGVMRIYTLLGVKCTIYFEKMCKKFHFALRYSAAKKPKTTRILNMKKAPRARCESTVGYRSEQDVPSQKRTLPTGHRCGTARIPTGVTPFRGRRYRSAIPHQIIRSFPRTFHVLR
jgi:hypothetical protein